MRVTVLKEIPEDSELARDWNQLVERMEHPEVFFTYQWALAVNRAFHATLLPLLFLMHDGSRLCGVAALAAHKGTETSFLTAGTADYCDVVSAPETRGDVLACLLREVSKLGLHRLSLSNLPGDSITWKELPAACRAQRLHLAWRPAHEIALVEFGSDEQRVAMITSVGRKKAIKHALRDLSKQGSVQIRHLVGPGESVHSLSEIVSAQVSRFLATGRISPLVRPERRVFLQELSNLLSAQGWLRISRLEVNEQPFAWNYGFRFAGSWFWYLPSFKLDYENLSPGSCLLRLAVEEGCSDSSIRELDLGLGDEPYKSRFATTARTTYHVQLSRSLWPHALNSARNFAKTKAVGRFPKAAAWLRQARDVTYSVQRRIRKEGLNATMARPVRLIASQDEMLFFEAPATDRLEAANMWLEPATWGNLAEAAIANSDDADTLKYLLGLAPRLREEKASASVLYDSEKRAVHFLSVASADGFQIEALNHTIAGAESQDTVIFDWWTPPRFRSRSYHPLAIRLAAAELQNNGRRVWIFCAATNTPSIREILKAGFTYRYSLVRQQRLGQSTIVRRDRTYALQSSKSVIGERADLVVGTGIGA